MVFLLRIRAIILTVARRIPTQLGLVLAMVTGMVASISLILSVPLYADAIYYRTFMETLSPEEGRRHPYNFLLVYNGGWSGTLEWEAVVPVDDYLTRNAPRALGLPVEWIVRFYRTEPTALFPSGTTDYRNEKARLDWLSVGFISDLQEQVRMVEGSYPAVAAQSATSTIEVMISEAQANKLGAQPGDEYVILVRGETQSGVDTQTQFPIRISGIWKAADPTSAFWPTNPDLLDAVLFVPEETYSDRISPYLSNEVYIVFWHLVMDGSEVRVDDVPALTSRINTLQHTASALLDGVRLQQSPLQALIAYRNSANLLTIFLYAFSIPVIGLILAFISLVAGLSVESQRNQIAVLRSRGATAVQILGMISVEGLLVGLTAFAISVPLSLQLVRWVGRTRSFLDFRGDVTLDPMMTFSAVQLGLLAVLIGLAAQVLPAVQASRHTIVSYTQERARMLRPPWWQRAWLDVLLLIPAGYGTYLLSQQGVMVLPDAAATGDPFGNPLLFLVPALSIFALTLALLRLIPLILAGLAWMASFTKSVGLFMAARQLARTPKVYSTPLVILVLTLSLSAYTASLAYTLDNHLHDQTFYQVGADLRFSETGQSTTGGASGFMPAPAQQQTPAEQPAQPEGPLWLFLPVTEYTRVAGVHAAARVGRYSAIPQLPGGPGIRGTLIGVDRIDFPLVSFWRTDFAAESLGGLMNSLAVQWNGMLVPRSFLAQNGLRQGDLLRMVVQTYGTRTEVETMIAGSFDLFPTWFPNGEPLFVANLDFIFEQIGNEIPYEIWLDVDPGVDPEWLAANDLSELNPGAMRGASAQARMISSQQRPDRQGLFGLLFIGFAAAAILTVLGFLLFVLFSFRRRFIELGVLRASGLSEGQMASYLTWELVFLILFGVGAGTGLGILSSYVYIPYLQIGLDAASRVPPFQVEVAWPAIFHIYSLFGALFLVTLVVLVVLLRRMKIFQAIKLGETV
ncbi:MAG TPA: ABC transporter permease [Levilinea sp.]|nr:ABC transporter permease [Levilinea sp.]